MNNHSNSLSFVGSEEHPEQHQYHVIQMTSSPSSSNGGGVDLSRFLQDVASIKDEFDVIDSIRRRLMDYHEKSKNVHDADSIKDLRARMDSDVTLALGKARLIKFRLETLDQSYEARLKSTRKWICFVTMIFMVICLLMALFGIYGLS
ncbi:hypothetical protein L1049_008965 [Liquidambar formosana]|uniref:Syntaxin N-terminal domain-containing protein n=1 Tax=Liquidambar formosana TaxID=63359 RepID=A0AAP0S546_LIQFO